MCSPFVLLTDGLLAAIAVVTFTTPLISRIVATNAKPIKLFLRDKLNVSNVRLSCFRAFSGRSMALDFQQVLNVFPAEIAHHLLIGFNGRVDDGFLFLLQGEHLFFNRALGD